MNNISDFDLGWLVGIIEGEGTVNIRKRGRGADYNPEKGYRYEIAVVVNMTDRDVIESLQRVTGVGTTTTINSPSHLARGHKTLYRWTVAKQCDTLDLLASILPHLHVRRTERFSEAHAILKETNETYWRHASTDGAERQRRHRAKLLAA